MLSIKAGSLFLIKYLIVNNIKGLLVVGLHLSILSLKVKVSEFRPDLFYL